MRRKELECNDKTFLMDVLRRAEVMHLAMIDGGWPYCIPVNFAAKDGALYIHCALTGHKLDCIRANPRVAFSAAVDIEIALEKSTTYFRSICGRGIAKIIEDEAEKGMALDLIAAAYGALCARPAPLANIRRVGIIRIDIESLTGKKKLPK